MNHLEQLVAEWLQYRGYFVRMSVSVGARPRGGFEGDLDVVGLNLLNKHLVHVECSLDSDSWEKRQQRFSVKFERGRRHINEVFRGLALPENLGSGSPSPIRIRRYPGGWWRAACDCEGVYSRNLGRPRRNESGQRRRAFHNATASNVAASSRLRGNSFQSRASLSPHLRARSCGLPAAPAPSRRLSTSDLNFGWTWGA
jgi:hypothetical protein